MIAVVKLKDGQIVGWMLGTDTHDLRRRAMATFDNDLATLLYNMEFPPPGKTEITPNLFMLVE